MELMRLLKTHGPQGWWPRLVVGGEQGAVSVMHHPGPKTRWLSKTKNDQAFEVALGAILTQNTAWINVEKALVCLAGKGLTTSRSLSRARLPSIESCVRSSGYYRQKAKKLKLLAKFVEEESGGDLHKLLSSRPTWRDLRIRRSLDCARDDGTREIRIRLLAQWGIGPETADTILLYGLDCPVFVVDNYTRRLLYRLTDDASWQKRPYDEVRDFCEKALGNSPAKEFQETHALIVRWGKENR